MVTNILIKRTHKADLIAQEKMDFSSTKGIAGGVTCNPLRQLLILPSAIVSEFHLHPGDLRENLVVNYDHLHDLTSGTVLSIGNAHVRLTFHCEPCKIIKDKVAIARIQHKRGYFGQFLNDGTIHLGDAIQNLGTRFEPIPYAVKDRIHWYLAKQADPIPLTRLLLETGLPNFYARTIPGILKQLPEDLRTKVTFKNRRAQLPQLFSTRP